MWPAATARLPVAIRDRIVTSPPSVPVSVPTLEDYAYCASSAGDGRPGAGERDGGVLQVRASHRSFLRTPLSLTFDGHSYRAIHSQDAGRAKIC